jgi:hypothetical protein
MPIFVYITDQCKADIDKHGKKSAVYALKDSVELKQSYSEFDNYIPSPYLKKRLAGQFRLIAKQTACPNSVLILSFVMFCHRDEDSYRDFLKNYQPSPDRIPDQSNLDRFIAERMSTESKVGFTTPSEIEYQMLYDASPFSEFDDVFIYESERWIKGGEMERGLISRYRLSIYQTLSEYQFSNNDESIEYIQVSEGIVIKAVSKWSHHVVYLDGIYKSKEEANGASHGRIDELLAAQSAEESRFLVQKMSRKAYPYSMLADENYWFKIQENEEGNFSLSPEEAELVSSILEQDASEKYPLFINGRPGSGKSTILQYLYSHELSKYLTIQPSPLFPPPLYITYSDKLLSKAKDSVLSIINSSYKLVELNTNISIKTLDKCFWTYSKLLISLIPDENKAIFLYENRIDFYTFKTEWQKKRINHLPAELIWHVIRTYIKGMSSDDDYFDIDSYKELPQKQKSVSDELFAQVWKDAWLNWYSEYSTSEGRWDDQDLTRYILSQTNISMPEFPGVFCDEAQDFTRIEIAMVSRFNLFTRRELNVNDPINIPLAFAGDPYQTINPTGFDWDAVRATFSDKLSSELCRFSNKRINVNLQDLSYNYRSNKDIVGLCNTIQVLRGIIFRKSGMIPQQSWFSESSGVGNFYFDIDTKVFKDMFQKYSDVVIIIPCQEGEEESYLRNDPFLGETTRDNPGLPLNVLSALSAKGLEFSMVILYKFGEQCLLDHTKIVDLIDNPETELEFKDKLPMEYYFNRLFVAASRPRTRCVVADTGRAIERFWENPHLTDSSYLVKQYNNAKWLPEYLSCVYTGSADMSWSEDRDDPLEIAHAMKESAKSEQNPYKMRLAATNFKRAGKQREADECTAWHFLYIGEYIKAADVFKDLGVTTKANELYWKAKDFGNVFSLGLVGTTEYMAADYLLNKDDTTKQTEFLDFLYSNHHNIKQLYLDPVWKHVIKVLLTNLSKDDAVNKDNGMPVFIKLKALHDAKVFHDGKIMGKVSYVAGQLDKAITYWEEAKDKSALTSQEYYYAKAETTAYPDNLAWLHKAKDNTEIIKITSQNAIDDLSDSALQIVFEAYEQERKIPDLFKLIENNTYVGMMIALVNSKQIVSQLGNEQLMKASKKAICLFDDAGHWGNIVKVVNILHARKMIDKSFLTELIILMAKSTKLLENKESTKALTDQISANIYNKKKNYAFPLSFMITGLAIEKNNMLIEALKFYEGFWKRSDNVPRVDQQYAKERWLKSKQRYVNYLQGRDMSFQKHLDELTSYAKEWKIKLSTIPDYPELNIDILTEHTKMDDLLDDTTEKMVRTLLIDGQFNVETVANKLSISVEQVKSVQETLAKPQAT